jgi:hypothetical protein
MTLLCKKRIVAKSKQVKTGCSQLLRKAMAQKGLFANNNDDDDDDDDDDDQ